VTNGSLGTWTTGTITNGLYTIRMRAWDKAGNLKTVTIKSTVGNFSASQSVRQLNVGASETVTYTSIIPFNLTQTMTIANAPSGTGTQVRTLLNAVPRSDGTFNDTWNGKTAANAVLPDGPYYYFVTVTDGTHTLNWDLSTQYWNGTSGYNDQ